MTESLYSNPQRLRGADKRQYFYDTFRFIRREHARDRQWAQLLLERCTFSKLHGAVRIRRHQRFPVACPAGIPVLSESSSCVIRTRQLFLGGEAAAASQEEESISGRSNGSRAVNAVRKHVQASPRCLCEGTLALICQWMCVTVRIGLLKSPEISVLVMQQEASIRLSSTWDSWKVAQFCIKSKCFPLNSCSLFFNSWKYLLYFVSQFHKKQNLNFVVF